LYKHGITVMRAQPFHKGHARLIDVMLHECEEVTVLIGSAQESGSQKNPFNFEQRELMIENCYDLDNVFIIGIHDINNPKEWPHYVLERASCFCPDGKPDVYYGGTEYDVHWFRDILPNIRIIDRTSPDFPHISGTMVRDLILYGDERWKQYVPECNWRCIELFQKGLLR
jgi:bifunctional NMN adenylyltransferase/nudix hydrolase